MLRLETPLGKLHFQPLDPKRVTMYVCGPTVYDTPHLGNARSAVVFDVLFRRLQHLYGADHVVFAKNFTDIDDKIITKANELGIGIGTLTQRTIADYEDAMAALNVLPPTHAPRATDHIDQMNRLIERLVELCVAYVSDGHVLFSVANARTVTRLGEVDRLAGARIAVESYKDDPRDFVLWKPAKENEPAFSGPFGMPGRPGWHVECSAMIKETLGDTIDIHGGGNDLMFPHHECEIMQSETATGHVLAQHWLHNGMLTVDGRKMSKSAGNFVTVPEALTRVPGEALRYLLLSGHYRQPLDFTWDKLTEAKKALDRLYRALQKVWGADLMVGELRRPLMNLNIALNDDLNTPDALAALHEYAENAFDTGTNPHEARDALLRAGQALGLLQNTPDQWFRSADNEAIETLIAERENYRRAKDFAGADAIRAQLRELGVAVEDTPTGPIWQTI